MKNTVKLFALCVSLLAAGAPAFAEEDAARICSEYLSVEKYEQAFPHCRQAAEQGDTQAQNNLGGMYSAGYGVAEDQGEAVRWFRKAAEQGDMQAQNNLGAMYARGYGIAKDPREAARWFRKSAEQGDAQGQNSLGAAYLLGEGVVQDNKEAYIWFSLAVDSGDEDAKGNRDLVAGNMTAAKIRQAKAEKKERVAEIDARKAGGE